MTEKYKRLVVLSDGTWQTLENPIPTNILKLTLSLRREDDEGVQQVLFYDSGIGTKGPIDKLKGGGLGDGIDANIMEMYTWLATNYDDGDEIYLFGFSRGSYTVRSLAGFMYESGLVRRPHLQFVKEAYDLYRGNEDIDSEDAVNFRGTHGGRVPIKLLACFDTVGSLGLPFKGWGPLAAFDSSKYRFHSTELSPLVENAIHAMSIDEDREIFSITKMERHPDASENQLSQLYFAGGHGGVGGGDSLEVPLSDFALNWMVSEIKKREIPLAFEDDMIPKGSIEVAPKGGAASGLFQFIEVLTGKAIRKVEGLEECHPSVFRRFKDMKEWRPKALEPLKDEILALDDEEIDTALGLTD